MAWTLRKSKKIGPFRLTLSKTGIGVSAGVKGARIGRTPKGDVYVSAGGGGVYSRETIHKASKSAAQPSATSYTAGIIATAVIIGLVVLAVLII